MRILPRSSTHIVAGKSQLVYEISDTGNVMGDIAITFHDVLIAVCREFGEDPNRWLKLRPGEER